MRDRIKIIIAVVLLVIAATVAFVLGFKMSHKKAAEAVTTTKATTTTTEAETTTEETTTEETTTAAPTTAAPTTTTTTKAASVVNSDGSVSFSTDANYASSHKYCVGVNRQQNVVTVYGKDDNGAYTKPVCAFACSCGRLGGNETPTGTFKTSDRVDWLYMVDNTYGQYTTRINGPIWFHSVCYFTKDKSNLEYDEFNKLGNNASLGCVRLCCRDAKWIYDNLDYGTIVTVYDSTNPGPLGKPAPARVDVNSANRGWDPTDPDPNNPWNK